MIMELSFGWWVFTALLGGVIVFYGLLKRANEWLYESSLGAKKLSLPPGDLGWPLIGTMWPFFKAFKYGNPDSFLSSFAARFGDTRMYKALMFGNPTIIVTSPEACRRVLMDDECFGPGWPVSVTKLMGKKGLHNLSNEEHRRLLRLTAAPVRGHEALSGYLDHIKDIVIASLDEWARMEERPIEFLEEMKKIALKVILNVLLSGDTHPRLEDMEKEYSALNEGVKSTPINLPGFAYHKAMKARKKLVKIFQDVYDERLAMIKRNQSNAKRDMLDLLMEVEDENGKLSDEEIIDLLIIYLTAGHESSSLATMWVVMLLEEHPQYFQKAKEEQEEIVKKRLSKQAGLSFKEIREMQYLPKVIDETLRLVNLSFALFREAKCDIEMSGYTIPKGWKVLAWIRNVHLNHDYYSNPNEFNPSRWEDYTAKAGTYIPFGGGSRLCPGRDLAKLQVSVFLHYYLLNYKFERLNPKCRMRHLPLTTPVDNCLGRIKKLSQSPR